MLYLEIFTVAYLAIIAALTINKLSKGYTETILIILLVHILLSGVPIALDLIQGYPETDFPFIERALRDQRTSIIYNFYISLTATVWHLSTRKKRIIKDKSRVSKNKNRISQPFLSKGNLAVLRVLIINAFLFYLAVLPLLLLIMAPNPEIFMTYGATAKGLFSDSQREFYDLLKRICLISILACFTFAAGAKSKNLTRRIVLVLPFLILSAWLIGKRNPVAIILFLFGSLIIHRRVLLHWKFLIGILLSVIIFSSFSNFYQSSVRGINTDTKSAEELYTDFRLNFGRDHTIKSAIYAELENMPILEYRGQSILFNLTFYVPRNMWPEKPFPYTRYFTSTVVYQNRLPLNSITWGLTTSWLDEAIANFSWLGLLLGPMLPLSICYLGDRFSSKNSILYTLTILTSAFLLVVSFVEFVLIFIIWMLLLLNEIKNNKIIFSSLST